MRAVERGARKAVTNSGGTAARPRIALLHYTTPPVVGDVETAVAEQARRFAAAGYPVCVVTGRGEDLRAPGISVAVIPEMDSSYPRNLAVMEALERDETASDFERLQAHIARGLAKTLAGAAVVIAHNVMTTHVNLPLTAALHRLADNGAAPRVIALCHDISRHVNPASGAPQYAGYPWDLLHTYRPAWTYVAVSVERQLLLAATLGRSPQTIEIVPNGVDAVTLLGLSDLGQHLVDTYGLMEADLVLLMPVRISRAKHVEYALRVIAALKAAGVCPRLVVTGPPDPHAPGVAAYYAELRRLRHILELEREALFAYEGTPEHPCPLTLNSSVVGELYRVCDLVLVPSLRDGFGLPLLEGALMDRAVFTSAAPVAEEFGHGRVQRIGPQEPAAHVAARILAWSEQDTTHLLRRSVRRSYTWPAIFASRIEPMILRLSSAPARN